MPGSKIVSTARQPKAYRDGTKQRYEAEVEHAGQRFKGYFNTYWFVGQPVPGEVTDLRRADHGTYLRFHYGDWTREFGAWFVVLGLAAVGLPAYFGLRRRIERREREATG
jgi:hypothetical protein